MRQTIAKALRAQVHQAATNGYPNMDRRFAYKQAKKDYKALQKKQRGSFNIMEPEAS